MSFYAHRLLEKKRGGERENPINFGFTVRKIEISISNFLEIIM
jgi:hypothetical protein